MRASGVPVKELDEKPEIPEDLEWYISVWNLLSLARPSGMSQIPEPISLGEIYAYAELVGLTSAEDRLLLARYVLRIDTAMRSAYADRAKRQQKG